MQLVTLEIDLKLRAELFIVAADNLKLLEENTMFVAGKTVAPAGTMK